MEPLSRDSERLVIGAFLAHPQWGRVSEASIQLLASHASVIEYDRGERIAREDDRADFAFIVIRGRIRGVHYSMTGAPFTALTVYPGALFGIMSIVHGGHYVVDYEARERSAVALLAARDLYAAAVEDPALMSALLESMGEQFSQVANAYKMMASGVPRRVAMHLYGMCDTDHAKQPVLHLGMSRTELAAALGTTPVTLSRCFHDLQEEGVIDSDGSEAVRLVDCGALARLAGVED